MTKYGQFKSVTEPKIVVRYMKDTSCTGPEY